MQIVQAVSPPINISFFGDYDFGGWTGAHRRDLSDQLVKFFSRPLNGSRAAFVFAAHTNIEPYFNCVLLSYRDAAPVAIDYAKKDSAQLRTYAGPVGFTIETVPLNGRVFQRASYQLRNKETDKNVRFDEYFTPCGDRMLRFIFWTTEANDDSFRTESQDILATLKLTATEQTNEP
jgi:hypothetical protein